MDGGYLRKNAATCARLNQFKIKYLPKSDTKKGQVSKPVVSIFFASL